MELKGKLFKKLPTTTGQGKNGEWKKEEFVISIDYGQFSKKVCISAWGDKGDPIATAKEGDTITVQFDIESREYKDRWFTEVKAWKIEVETESTRPKTEEPAPMQEKQEEQSDLPF